MIYKRLSPYGGGYDVRVDLWLKTKRKESTHEQLFRAAFTCREAEYTELLNHYLKELLISVKAHIEHGYLYELDVPYKAPIKRKLTKNTWIDFGL